MKTLYVVLTKSKTILSTLINSITHDEYTHASLSFSDTIQPMYSFGRLIGLLSVPAALKEEPLDRGFYKIFAKAPIGVYAIQVSEQGYQKVVDYFNSMWQHHQIFRFSSLGLIACQLKLKWKRKHHYFCSQFVAEALQSSGEIDIKKSPTLYHPVDFLQIEGLKCLYKGTVESAIGKKFTWE